MAQYGTTLRFPVENVGLYWAGQNCLPAQISVRMSTVRPDNLNQSLRIRTVRNGRETRCAKNPKNDRSGFTVCEQDNCDYCDCKENLTAVPHPGTSMEDATMATMCVMCVECVIDYLDA